MTSITDYVIMIAVPVVAILIAVLVVIEHGSYTWHAEKRATFVFEHCMYEREDAEYCKLEAEKVW
jgi:hypothetical protein